MKASDNYVMNLHKEAFMVTVVDSFNTSTSLHRYTLQTAKSTKQCSLGTFKFSLNNPFKKKLPKNVETTHKLDFCAGERLGFPLVLLVFCLSATLFNSFIPVLHLALLPLISVFLCIRNPFVPGFSEEKLCKRGCVRLSYLCV